jgi:hypothetical protein
LQILSHSQSRDYSVYEKVKFLLTIDQQISAIHLFTPLKCGYNPYTCEWEEWSTNPLKQKAIGYYGMRSIIDTETSK